MASNYTENYALCQWQPTDQVQRTDFNADNARLEAALSSLEARVAELYRAVPNLAYNVYDLALKDFYESGYHGYRRALLMQNFHAQDTIASLTGGLVIQNNTLVLSGAGQTGVMTSLPLVMSGVSWNRVIAWMRYAAGATYTMAVNGTVLTKKESRFTTTFEGEECVEARLESEASGSVTATVTLTLETNSSAGSAAVYDYGILFF